MVSGVAGHSSGIKANALHDYSYVWNGNSGVSISSVSIGTYNINPKDGLSGFYIGSKNLASYLGEKADLTAFDDSIAEIKIETTALYKKSGIYLAERDDTSKPIVIDWGDGTVEEVNGNVS